MKTIKELKQIAARQAAIAITRNALELTEFPWASVEELDKIRGAMLELAEMIRRNIPD